MILLILTCLRLDQRVNRQIVFMLTDSTSLVLESVKIQWLFLFCYFSDQFFKVLFFGCGGYPSDFNFFDNKKMKIEIVDQGGTHFWTLNTSRFKFYFILEIFFLMILVLLLFFLLNNLHSIKVHKREFYHTICGKNKKKSRRCQSFVR